jgi:hypothetical protein
LAARSGLGVAQVTRLLDIAPDDRPDRVGLGSGAPRRGLDGDRAKIGRWDVQYYEEFIPTALADHHAIATPAPAEKFIDVGSRS